MNSHPKSHEGQHSAEKADVAAVAPEKQREVTLENAFGETMLGQLSDDVKQQLLTNPKKYELLVSLSNENAGDYFESNPQLINKALNLLGVQPVSVPTPARRRRQNETAQALEEVETTRPVSGVRKLARTAFGVPYNALNNAIIKGYSKIFDKQWAQSQRFQAMSEAEQTAYIEKWGKWTTRGVIGALGAVSLYAAARWAGYEYGGGSGAHDALDPHGDGQTDQNGDSLPGDDGSLQSLEALRQLSIKRELDFLNTNGRVHNNFNNIPVDSVNSPEHATLFLGYDKLMNQYQQSPTELSAQLHQIQTIEMEKGNVFESLPKELRLQSGENNEAYVARLSDAIHNDQKLHDTLVGSTMDYLKDNGKSPEAINSEYKAWYITDDGKVVAHWDTSVVSADPNDKIIRLSDTKGIRLPCGQPIELSPVYDTPTYVPQAQNWQPQPVYVAPQAPVASYAPEYPSTPIVPEVPITPVIPEVPIIPEVPVIPEIPVIPEVPIIPEVPVIPEIPVIPVVPLPKNPLEDINVNPGLPEQIKMGDVRVGPGAPQTIHDVTPEPTHYEPPKPVVDNTDKAPGASSGSGLHGRGQSQQSGVSTGSSSGSNSGVTSGNVGE